GVITSVTLKVVAERPSFCLAWVPFADRARGLAFVDTIRRAAVETRHTRDARGLDVSAIEHLDERCLALLREDGADRQDGVPIPAAATLALLVTIELPSRTDARTAYDEIGRAGGPDAPDTPLVRFLNLLSDSYCSMLSASSPLDEVIVAVPG